MLINIANQTNLNTKTSNINYSFFSFFNNFLIRVLETLIFLIIRKKVKK